MNYPLLWYMLQLTSLIVSNWIWRHQRYVWIGDHRLCSISLFAEEIPSEKQSRPT